MCLSLCSMTAFADTTKIDTVSVASVTGLVAKDVKVTFKESNFEVIEVKVFNSDDTINPLADNTALVEGNTYTAWVGLQAKTGYSFDSTKDKSNNFESEFVLYDVNGQIIDEPFVVVGSEYNIPMDCGPAEPETDTVDDMIYAGIGLDFVATKASEPDPGPNPGFDFDFGGCWLLKSFAHAIMAFSTFDTFRVVVALKLITSALSNIFKPV